MAVVVENLLTGLSTVFAIDSVTVTPVIQPVAGTRTLLLVAYHKQTGEPDPLQTVVGNNLVWEQRYKQVIQDQTDTDNSAIIIGEVWEGVGDSPVDGQVTMTWAGNVAERWYAFGKVTGGEGDLLGAIEISAKDKKLDTICYMPEMIDPANNALFGLAFCSLQQVPSVEASFTPLSTAMNAESGARSFWKPGRDLSVLSTVGTLASNDVLVVELRAIGSAPKPKPTRRLLAKHYRGTGGTSLAVLSSLTPSQGKLLIARVSNKRNAGPTIPTFTAYGYTWVQVRTALWGQADARRTTTFRARGTDAPTADLPTANFGSDTNDQVGIDVYEADETLAGGINGSAAVVQSAAISVLGDSVLTIPFDDPPKPGSTVMVLFSRAAIDITTPVPTPEDGYALLSPNAIAPGQAIGWAHGGLWRTSGEATPSLTLNANDDIVGIAIELASSVVVPLTYPVVYDVLLTDLSGAPIDSLPWKNLQFSYALNDVGSCNFTLPLEHPKALRSLLVPAQRQIHIYRLGELVWGGYLWTVGGSSGEDQIRVMGEDWFSRLKRRYVDIDQVYTNADQFDIAWGLIDFTQLKTGGGLGITRDSATPSGVLRSATYYAWERPIIAQALIDLSEVANGIDFEITPDKKWKNYLKKGTSYATSGLTFELGKNLDSVALDDDGQNLFSEVSVLGGGEGAARCIAVASDTTVRDAYGLLQEPLFHSDINSFSILSDIATEELRIRKVVRAQPQISTSLFPPFGAYAIGDEAKVRAKKGWLDIEKTMRIVALNVQVSDQGREVTGVFLDEVVP